MVIDRIKEKDKRKEITRKKIIKKNKENRIKEDI